MGGGFDRYSQAGQEGFEDQIVVMTSEYRKPQVCESGE
jgi:hypothetical protein